MTQTVALYARVSKADMSQDPENQLALLRERADALDLVVAEEYTDRISGARDHRPALERMRAQARARRFGSVMATKLDRIGRSTLHLLSVTQEFEQYKVRLTLAEQPIDTGTPMGKFFIVVLAGVAELERGFIKERTLLGLAKARKDGRRLGRHPADCGCGLVVADESGRVLRVHDGARVPEVPFRPEPVDAPALGGAAVA